MKKLIIVFLLLSMLATLCACGKTEASDLDSKGTTESEIDSKLEIELPGVYTETTQATTTGTTKENTTESSTLAPYGTEDRMLGCWTTEKEGAYIYLFLPNGTYVMGSHGYTHLGTWYTAEPDVLCLRSEEAGVVLQGTDCGIYKYIFADTDTFTVSCGDEELTFTRSTAHFSDIAYSY